MAPTQVARFVPVGAGTSSFELLEQARPGRLGTLMDEHVDPIDVVASVIDLAQRGHVLITELPRSGPHDLLDWEISFRPDGRDDLAPFEQQLLDVMVADGPARVSVLDGPTMAPEIRAIQEGMYDDLVRHGWYRRRPDLTRRGWSRLAWILLGASVLVTVLLAWLTSFGVLGLVLIAGALGLRSVIADMPTRTQQGSAVLAGLMALRGELMMHPTDEAPPGQEYIEISRVLGYAVVLGGLDRWIAALVRADDDPEVPDPTDLAWYHAPETWMLADFPASLNAFIAAMTGNLYKRG